MPELSLTGGGFVSIVASEEVELLPPQDVKLIPKNKLVKE
jgi:hypothetical protein